YVMVGEVLATGRVLLARKLTADHLAGDTIAKYQPSLTVTATSQGRWGNRIQLRLMPLDPGYFALRVSVIPLVSSPDTQPEEEFYKRLSLDPGNSYYASSLINSNSLLIRVSSAGGNLLFDRGPAGAVPLCLQGGRDGLSGVSVLDFTGGPSDEAP